MAPKQVWPYMEHEKSLAEKPSTGEYDLRMKNPLGKSQQCLSSCLKASALFQSWKLPMVAIHMECESMGKIPWLETIPVPAFRTQGGVKFRWAKTAGTAGNILRPAQWLPDEMQYPFVPPSQMNPMGALRPIPGPGPELL